MVILRNASIYEMIEEIDQRRFVVFGAGGSLQDFFKDFGEQIASKIVCIVDNYIEASSSFSYKSYKIPIVPWKEFLSTSEARGYAFLISTQKYEEVLRQLDKEEKCKDSICYILHAPFLWCHVGNTRGNNNVKIEKNETKIPKIIHYCWFGKKNIPELEQKCIASWKKYCPDYQFMFWNEDNYDVNKATYMKQAYEAEKYSFVSDYARLDVLYQYGGIYLDTDVELIKSLNLLLGYDGFFAFEYWNRIATGLGCGCIPRLKIMKELKKIYDNESFISKNGILNLKSCPEYHTEYFRNKGIDINNKTQIANNILFLSSDYLCPINQSTALYEIGNNTIGIHQFSCSWMPNDLKQKWDNLKEERQEWNHRLRKDYVRWKGLE